MKNERLYAEFGTETRWHLDGVELSLHLNKSINDLIVGRYQNSNICSLTILDCLYNEVQGSINSDQWSFVISKEQADYLRDVFL